MENLDLNQILQNEKQVFRWKHLDWYVATYIRNYPEFLEMDYQEAMDLNNNTLKIMKYWHNT